jgi:murein DD-endopeptidase MepM/ murein hydrolase activator NlpD
MSHKITFFVLSTSGAPVRQVSISRALIAFFVLVALGLAGGVGYYGYDYHQLRQRAFRNAELRERADAHREIVLIQRRQIRAFAEEINALKSRLVALNGFERQIRIIANLNPEETGEPLFGVGGSNPEDIDPKLALEARHDSLMREMHGQVDQMGQAVAVQRDGFESLIEDLEDKKNLLASTPAIRPARGVYTSRFGNRKSPFTGLMEMHEGLDIAGKKGTPVQAVADGRVTFAGRRGSYGQMLVIDHGHGMITRYAHLDAILKEVGDRVRRGDRVALMGNTGRSTGPHLHYEVRLNGVPVDPETYILN